MSLKLWKRRMTGSLTTIVKKKMLIKNIDKLYEILHTL